MARTLHLCFGGPVFLIATSRGKFRFEDHLYCGPMMLTLKTGEPTNRDWPEKSPFWYAHWCWTEQGKKTVKGMDGETWCSWEPDLAGWRKFQAKFAEVE